MFHVWGLVAGLTCLQDNRVQVRGPGSSAPSGKLVIEIMAVVDIHCIYAPLIILDDIVNNHSDDFSKSAGKIKRALFAGGMSVFLLSTHYSDFSRSTCTCNRKLPC